MKHYRLSLCIVAYLFSHTIQAQVTPASQMENLSRGVIAMPAQSGQGIYVSWRLLGTDPAATTSFDLLRDGTTIASDLGFQTNFTDAEGTSASKYQVVTKRNGEIVETTPEVSPQNQVYRVLQLDRPANGVDDITHEPYDYTPNDCSVGDVDGDGEYEIIVKWQPSNKTDNQGKSKHPGREYIDCYKLDGTKLWRLDMGLNILAGSQHTQLLVYDFDRDGKAEIILRTAPGTKDGQGRYVNQAADDPEIKRADNTIDWRSPQQETIRGGQEYLTIFEGATGRAIHTIFYNPNRDTGYGGAASGTVFNWDDRAGRKDYAATYGNRGDRFMAAVAYLDGPDQNPSAVLTRGYYTQAFLWAVDFKNNKLSQKWLHASMSKTKVEVTNANGVKSTFNYNSNTFGTSDYYTAYGQGNHNLSVADVDGDGCDEIIYGGATIDNNGHLLYSTGLGHGDAMHVADIIPSRPGYEVLRCCETEPYGLEIHDAKTGQMIFHQTAGGDTGRSLAADITSDYKGLEFWGAKGNAPRESASGSFNTITSEIPSMNFRIYWDGDLQEELFDGALDTETGIAHPGIMKWSGNGFVTTAVDDNGSQTCNWTKATPCLQADILGDWREELIMWNLNDPSQLNIISTNIPSDYRVPTLMHDHTYRLGVAWQNVGYNQPPHLGYYLPDYDFSCNGTEPPQPVSYNYSVNETVEGSIVRTTSGEDVANEVISVPYRRYNVRDGKLYLKGPSGGNKRLEYNHYFTLTTDNQVETLAYEPTDIKNVVFLAEAEDIPGMTLCDNNNMRVRSSNSAAAYVASGTVGFTTLEPGTYQLTAFIHDTSSAPDSYWSFLAGDREIANFNCTVVNIQEFQSEAFTITQPTTLYIPQCGNARRGIDLVYVKRVPILGDVNRDGQVDIYDVTALIDIILEGDTTPPYEMTQYDHEAADMNNDNSIDVYDVTLLIDFILDKD